MKISKFNKKVIDELMKQNPFQKVDVVEHYVFSTYIIDKEQIELNNNYIRTTSPEHVGMTILDSLFKVKQIKKQMKGNKENGK